MEYAVLKKVKGGSRCYWRGGGGRQGVSLRFNVGTANIPNHRDDPDPMKASGVP